MTKLISKCLCNNIINVFSLMQTDLTNRQGGKLTLVLNKLVEEAGFPRPGTANHQKLKQEV